MYTICAVHAIRDFIGNTLQMKRNSSITDFGNHLQPHSFKIQRPMTFNHKLTKTCLAFDPLQKEPPTSSRTVKVLNVSVTCTSLSHILRKMEDTIRNRVFGGYISITNTESVYHATRIRSHFNYINNADFSCCDGVGVVIGGKLLGYRIPRLYGPDLMLNCCEYGVDKKWRHFFYGGKKGVPELLSKKLTEKFPGLITAGMYSPPFRQLTPEEDKSIINRIGKTNPDILWVGLGLLKQERWIAEHLRKINVPWMIGVGAAFDFHAGTIKRAPQFFRRIGLEWFYRTGFEPRLIIRQFRGFMFLFSIVKGTILHRLHK
jgi:N-acetylglucosaminyldiphosphoundecaprenol N-acetyl-beta-D-mannosaminyltransferase